MPRTPPPESCRGGPSTSSAPSITAFKVQEKYAEGMRLLQSGHVLLAIQQFQEASFFDAEDALPIVALAECYVFLCDLRSAIRCYRRALWSLRKRKQRAPRGQQGQSATTRLAARDGSFHPNSLSSLITQIPTEVAAQPPLPPPQRPSTAQFQPTSVFLSNELLHAVSEGRFVPEGAQQNDVNEVSTEQLAGEKRQPTRGTSVLSQIDEGFPSTSGDGPKDTHHNTPPQSTASQETAPPHELTAAEVRARLAGVLDALGLALFQVGNVEQALRCTTEALELLAAAKAAEKNEMSAQAGGHSSPIPMRLFTKLQNPYMSEPTIALHRAVFLVALQREEEAEALLDSHYELFEDFRAQSAPLLIQLYCNRQAFRKARLLLESQEEGLQGSAATPGDERMLTIPDKEASSETGAADKGDGSHSPCPTQEGGRPEETTEEPADHLGATVTFPPLPTPLSLTVAKYIFTELYARYRSAAFTSDDEDSVTRCLDVYPNDVELLFRRAQLRIAAGELKRSVKDLFRCVQDTNGEHKEAIEAMTTVLFTIGSSLDGKSEMQNAVTYYSESLKWRPDNVLVLLARGDCYTKIESFEEALADYQAILNYAPEHREAQGRIAALHDLWGRKFYALDDPAQAEAEFTNAIKTDNKNPEYYYHRALCRLKLNHGQYALRDVLSCKELNPAAPHLRAFIARYMEPMQLAEAAEEKEKDNTVVHRTVTTSAASSRQTRMAKTNAAAKWYGSRTPPSLPMERSSARGGVTSRKKRTEESTSYGMSLRSSSGTAAVSLPSISTRRPPSCDAATEGLVQGYQTTLHRRQGEPLSQTK
ncbi:hypothetical protein ABB37_05106 [Leptomonas pyrrhocoris]|uniref:Tetratricopeptide repeat protein n=1 Tax=Leptomonas pyrrhocoris TaxID=157538 RepID=A0A0M9G180_LEPPY|nr:hypothetical protein ABB37_05106 [Leptomonas pyrrhocoris]KPA80106.1 hypothetical protein ABB37_05106 [Leptomonas pyrrhocoris]|eukprot:XP_015658545.1 hypothetical protein ABB37_05106 [Leptomonas pyrrhocoris]